MTVHFRASLVALACLACLFGCADEKDPQDTGPTSSTATTDDPTGGMTSDTSIGEDPTGGLPSMEVCERYLNCLAQVAPGGLPEAQQGYGPEGTCWKGSLETAEQCLDACQVGLDQWHEAVPDEPQCGPAIPPDPTGGVSGQYLLAISTTVGPDTPFQFLATFDIDAFSMLTLTLQPLTLAQGKVTTPRQPFGAPLQYTDIKVVDGQFVVDLGMIILGGPTNPITGADLTARLDLAAKVVDKDFVCGTVDGEVLDPPVGAITGSTFAAARIADQNKLPSSVILDCGGFAVTDP